VEQPTNLKEKENFENENETICVGSYTGSNMLDLFVSVLVFSAILSVPLSRGRSHNVATSTATGTVAIVNALDGTSNFNFTAGQKNVGDTIVMNITIVGATDIATWQVGIQWDKNALGFVSMVLLRTTYCSTKVQ